ncbi:ribulose-phosphate 3-epimerase [Halolactibacillus miurensis]|uniref:Ribulose-phosphate 3-epimerase n=1 Tax=Halolactibacillus miurensis TaxID=306541 RepID=A0A1I6Q2H0_9BACI|nr:ribulose-phosphate 3-epimerase [Halolactibacillus miurensis]GEM03340.1 ribulose-phosphate 3-epimerase [Halolactibacillus miurensis]SFS46508.1 ribulose-phosphate 3-epimerase [Halolactibacillus miurensis]
MQKHAITIAPSIMCADLANLEAGIREIEAAGLDTLHIDVIDGSFSPSMPLGIDTIKRLRELTDLAFDVHIMANDNEFFIQEMINIGVEQITFHLETSIHIDRYINLMKKNNVKVGVALNPATPLSVLEYVLPQVDTVLLMLINPGFATDKNEKQVRYANKKVTDLREMIDRLGLDTRIEVDGRVSLETITDLVAAGADFLVAGSTSLFVKGYTLAENKATMEEKIAAGLKQREES